MRVCLSCFELLCTLFVGQQQHEQQQQQYLQMSVIFFLSKTQTRVSFTSTSFFSSSSPSFFISFLFLSNEQEKNSPELVFNCTETCFRATLVIFCCPFFSYKLVMIFLPGRLTPYMSNKKSTQSYTTISQEIAAPNLAVSVRRCS